MQDARMVQTLVILGETVVNLRLTSDALEQKEAELAAVYQELETANHQLEEFHQIKAEERRRVEEDADQDAHG